jgi:formate dehydrogenase subunit gamma
MTTPGFDSKTANEIVSAYDARPEMLVQILHAFTKHFGHISEDAVRHLAGALNLSRAEIHGVVSYYHDFRTTKPGRHTIKLCQAEACQAMGSRELSAHAEKTIGDGITVEPVYCLGNCALSPAAMVDGKTYGRVSNDRLDEIVAELGEPG